MKNFFKIIGIIVVVMVIDFFFGCVSDVAYREMELITDVRSSQIVNLRNYWNFASDPSSAEYDFFRKGDSLMKNGFLNVNIEEYGYYVIDYLVSYVKNDPLGAVAWLGLFGVPVDTYTYRVFAYVAIYDSYGTEIMFDYNVGSFKHKVGLYYGRNPTKNAEKKLNELFTRTLQETSARSDKINQLLLEAGPITQQKHEYAIKHISRASYEARWNSSGGSSSWFSPRVNWSLFYDE